VKRVKADNGDVRHESRSSAVKMEDSEDEEDFEDAI